MFLFEVRKIRSDEDSAIKISENASVSGAADKAVQAHEPESVQRAERSSLRRVGPWISGRGFRVALSVGLLVFLFGQIDSGRMLVEIGNVRLDLVVPLFAIVVGIRLVSALRWHALLRARNQAISYLRVVRLMFVSHFVGYFTPGSLGIDLARLYGMARATADAALSVTSVAVERALGLLALLLLVLLGLAFHPQQLPSEAAPVAWLGLASLAVGTAVLMTGQARQLTLWLLSCRGLGRVRGAVQRVYLVLDEYGTRPGLLLTVFAITVVIQLLRCVAPAVGAAAFGVHLPLMVFIILMPVVIMLTLLPISIAGLGVREVAFVYLFGLAGMPAEVALPLSLLLRLLTMSLALPGAWLYMRHGLHA